MSAPLLSRIAGAPISWGVCEVPGWGFQLDPTTVLTQMRELSLSATEFGPTGFLPEDPRAKAKLLASYGLSAVGEFVPVVLHDATKDPTATFDIALDGLLAAGANLVIIAAASGTDGYDKRPTLDDDAWKTLAASVDRLAARAADRGVRAALHPHVGTMVESAQEIDRVLTLSSVALCLDTGHALIGGADPVALARDAKDRIAHMHLKDVDAAAAGRVRAGDLTYTEAVAAGMYRPLGDGDVDITAIVGSLEGAGYDGWYVLEQDTILSAAPDRAPART